MAMRSKASLSSLETHYRIENWRDTPGALAWLATAFSGGFAALGASIGFIAEFFLLRLSRRALCRLQVDLLRKTTPCPIETSSTLTFSFPTAVATRSGCGANYWSASRRLD